MSWLTLALLYMLGMAKVACCDKKSKTVSRCSTISFLLHPYSSTELALMFFAFSNSSLAEKLGIPPMSCTTLRMMFRAKARRLSGEFQTSPSSRSRMFSHSRDKHLASSSVQLAVLFMNTSRRPKE